MTECQSLINSANRLLDDVANDRVKFTTTEIGAEYNHLHEVDAYAVADILCSLLNRHGHQVDWSGTPPTIEVL